MQRKVTQISATDNRDDPDPLDIQAGERLKQRRELIGMSQKQLGEALGVSFQQIQKYERGTNRMAYSTAQRVATCLGVSIDWFGKDLDVAQAGFGESKQSRLDDAPSGAASLPEDVFESRETIALLRAYYDIADPKKRREIYRTIKDMKKDKQ